MSIATHLPKDKLTVLRGDILATLTDRKLQDKDQRSTIAGLVLKHLIASGQLYHHSERRDFDTCMYFDADRKRLERIRADSFLAWLSDLTCVNRADTLFRFMAAAIETEALSGKSTRGMIPEAFWAARPGAIYLSNGDGRAIKITAGDATEVDNGTDGVLFAAGSTLAPWKLTDPKDPFDTCGLFRNANCAALHGSELLRVWLLSLPTNPACKPPLVFAGDIGSGKTRLARGIAELYGVPEVIHKVEDSGEDDFWPCLDAGGLFTMDNADTKVKWLADAVANAATGGSSQRRKLYTDSERVTLRARSWLCLTTANPTFANDGGLADRLLPVRMNRRDDETSDSALSDEIKVNRDAGLSYVVHTLAKALADTKPVPRGLNQRHPDFADVAVKIGRAMNREVQVVSALRTAEADKSLFCIENDAVGSALLALLSNGEAFAGTAAELKEKLAEIDTGLAEYSPKRVGKRLSALWPHVEKVFVASQEKDRKGFSQYTMKARSAEFAEFQHAISTKPLICTRERTLVENVN